jgi:glycosyltransferase involved in cell wall biosynthesis
MTGRVSVVVRTKNRPVLLRRALADILGQSYEDTAIVVVNDGGDRAPVEALAAEHHHHLADGRLTVIHHEASLGMEAASNAGVLAGTSEFVAIHDDDDRWHRDFLAKTVGRLNAKPHAHGVAVRTEIAYEEIRGDAIVQTGSMPYHPQLQTITLTDMLRVNLIVPISFLYRRSVHDEIGMYNEELDAVGDWEFYLRFLQAHPMELLDSSEPLAFWCQRPSDRGDMGNSVIASATAHDKFDGLVRDAFLRREAGTVGLGTMLYLARMNEQQQADADAARVQVEELNRRIAALEETVIRRTSVGELLRRPTQLTLGLFRKGQH